VISIEDLERVAALGWQAPEEERLGGWLLRSAQGSTGRANSALALGDPGLPAAAAAERVRAWYEDRGLPGMISVPYPVGEAHRNPLDVLLDSRGWTVRSGAATVMVAGADAVTGDAVTGDAVTGGAANVEIEAYPDEAWLGRYHYRGQPLPPVAITLLISAPWQAFASVRREGETIAIGRVAAAAGWAGLTAIEVDPLYRRRGLGAAVTAALAAAAASAGANWLYLQVEDDNAAARALYKELGFADHHGYHYRVAPDA
jgi:N-acetylglutamate synthase